MKLAFIIDPLNSLNIKKDSTYLMMKEAISHLHAVFVIYPEDIYVHSGQVMAKAHRLYLNKEFQGKHDWYRLDPETITEPLTHFSAVLMRKDPPFNMEYVYTTYLLELAVQQGARVYNPPHEIRNFNEKLSIMKYQQFIVPTLVTSRKDLILEFLHTHQDIILKPLDGMGGSSIFRINHDDPNINVIIEVMTHYGQCTVMAQRYIPEIKAGDKRVLLINGEPMPYALARIPQKGETRGNLAAGGLGLVQELSPRDREIAETIGKDMKELGFLIVGLDIIGNNLTEINVTSPTCMQEILHQTDFNIASKVIQVLEELTHS